jgi:hypothetical protein
MTILLRFIKPGRETQRFIQICFLEDRYLFAVDGVKSIDSSSAKSDKLSTGTSVKNGQAEYFHRLLGVAVCSSKTDSDGNYSEPPNLF